MQDNAAKSNEAAGSSLVRRVCMPLLFTLAVAMIASVVWSSLVFVDEGEYVIVERFGEIVAVYDQPADRGLNFKLPWPIDSLRRFDRRVQLFRPPGREIFTADKKNVTVAAYVSWKIAEPKSESAAEFPKRPVVRFFRGLGSPTIAEARLDSRMRDLLNTELGRIPLSDLLSISDSHAGPEITDNGLLAKIATDVRRRLEQGRDGKPSLTEDLGIEIVDLRIRRINFPTGNLQAVYDRQRSERKKEADRYRTAGIAANKAIRSRADLQYERILAAARGDAERIRGAAEADAIALRNAAHAMDPEFYIALRTLQTYKKILNDKTTLVLSASSPLLKLLTEGIPNADAKPKTPNGKTAAEKKR